MNTTTTTTETTETTDLPTFPLARALRRLAAPPGALGALVENTEEGDLAVARAVAPTMAKLGLNLACDRGEWEVFHSPLTGRPPVGLARSVSLRQALRDVAPVILHGGVRRALFAGLARDPEGMPEGYEVRVDDLGSVEVVHPKGWAVAFHE